MDGAWGSIASMTHYNWLKRMVCMEVRQEKESGNELGLVDTRQVGAFDGVSREEKMLSLARVDTMDSMGGIDEVP